jgi:hypothetical protein
MQRPGSECLNVLSRRWTSASELRYVASNLSHLRFHQIREVAWAHRSGFVWDRLHPALAACSRGVSERIFWSVWWGLAGAISQRGHCQCVHSQLTVWNFDP